MVRVVKEIGEENVVQVITINEVSFKTAQGFIDEEQTFILDPLRSTLYSLDVKSDAVQ